MHIQNDAKDKTIAILERIFADYPTEDFAVRLWDGTTWPDGGKSSSPFTLVLNHPGALRKMFLPPSELNLGEAYIYGDFDVEGDLIAAFSLSVYFQNLNLRIGDKLGLARQLFTLPNTAAPQEGWQGAAVHGERHSRERDRQVISYHYDVSNDFYALWLDKHMVYSCAYFATLDEDIHTAQERKLDYICRKLRLQPGERLLDIGCGWGGLAIYAAQHYGVDALGITLSEPQVDWASERIVEAGLEDRCRVAYMDYREVTPVEPFDKLVSVGMFEHVGEEKMRIYFDRAWDLLWPQGLFLNHAIARPAWEPSRADQETFSNQYVFPDGELVPVGVSSQVAEDAGFEVRDVESLREHYALTLRRWVRRLESEHEAALRHVDEVTYRIWRLYMAGSAHGFESGRLNVYQTLFAKPSPEGESGLSLTREDLYRPQVTERI
ncbi:MAG: class I SAM-dependent methyltransferase [Anaerolineales bacterium]